MNITITRHGDTMWHLTISGEIVYVCMSQHEAQQALQAINAYEKWRSLKVSR